MTSTAYVNGHFVPLKDANVSVLDRGFLFADGIYEVAAVIDGKLVDNGPHLARLARSVEEIDLALPVPLEAIEALQRELVARNGMREGLVYLQVTRGAADDRDFVPPVGLAPTLVMFVQPRPIVDSPTALVGIAVKSMPDIRWARRDIKSVALLAQVLAKREAHAAGCAEAWMLAEDGTVTEGASSSAFIVTADGTLVTRPNSRMILPGCTGAAVAALCAETGIRLEYRAFTLDEALSAQEAFITSASTFVMPVVTIDGMPIGDGKPGPVAQRLRALYIAFAKSG